MKGMLLSGVLALAVLITGCSSPMGKEELAFAQAQLNRPTFEVECPAGGCNFSRFAYYDPSVKIAMPTNGYDLANTAIGGPSSILLGVAPYYFISKGIESFADGGNSTVTTTTDNSVSTQSSIMDSYNPTETISDSYSPITNEKDPGPFQ